MLKCKLSKFDDLYEKARIQDQVEEDRLKQIGKDIDDVILSYRQEDSYITFEQLDAMGYEEWLEIGHGVRFKRFHHPIKKLYFITEMDPSKSPTSDARLKKQRHDCKEYCEVLEGELVELAEGGKRYEAGDLVIYPAGFSHLPTSTVFSRYGIEFIDPN